MTVDQASKDRAEKAATEEMEASVVRARTARTAAPVAFWGSNEMATRVNTAAVGVTRVQEVRAARASVVSVLLTESTA